jgi:hypothetical protein
LTSLYIVCKSFFHLPVILLPEGEKRQKKGTNVVFSRVTGRNVLYFHRWRGGGGYGGKTTEESGDGQ